MVITTTMARYSIIINSDGSAMSMRTTMTTMMIMMAASASLFTDGAVVEVGADVAAGGTIDGVGGVGVAPMAGASRGVWPVAVQCTPPRQSAPDPRGPLAPPWSTDHEPGRHKRTPWAIGQISARPRCINDRIS